MKKVFLGGTCNDSTWRDRLIPLLKCDYFNPVVENWTPECQEREGADFVLYFITPAMVGVYSIAEAVDDSNKRPQKTIFAVVKYNEDGGFDKKMWKSLETVANMVIRNGGKAYSSESENSLMEMVAAIINL